MELMMKMSEAALREYGVYPELLSEKIASAKNADAVIAALNNADVTGASLKIFDTASAKVFEGMKLLGTLAGTDNLVLHIPAYAAALATKLADEAEKNGVKIVVGIVNKRAAAASLVTHILSCVDVADINAGCYNNGTYVSVDGGELYKADPATRLCDLLPASVKGVQAGYKVYNADVLGKTIAEVNPENGVINSINADDCVVDLVDKHLVDCRVQSCGKCVFCREGLLQLEAMQKDITVGKGRMDEIDITREIGDAMTYSTPCSMGQMSSLMATSAVDAFAGEYEEHIKKKKCRAEVCKAFQKVYVDPSACIGCEKCAPACPENAIDGAQGYIHVVFDNWCTRCGECISACPEGAIHKTTERTPKLPDRMMRVGRFTK